MFTKNVHPVERVVRVLAGLSLVSLAFWGPSNPWFLIGIVPILTGVFGYCPPYAFLGINTCNLGKKETSQK